MPNKREIIRAAIEHRDRCLLALGGQPDIMAWNAPTGTFRAPSGAVVKIGVRGQADILGEITVTLWGVPLGFAFACEAKFGTGRLDDDQRAWRDNWIRRGNLYVLGRDPAQVVEQLRAQAREKIRLLQEAI